MRRFIFLSLVCGMLLVSVGCIMVSNPMSGGLFVQAKGPVAGVDNSVQPSAMGCAEAMGIIGVVTGDASIEAAMAQGGITKVHHVDVDVMSVLGIYGKVKTVVWGEK